MIPFYERDGATLYHGDCRDILPGLPAASVDAVVTDPPYPCIRRDYGEWTEAKWFELMRMVVPECMRILKPSGSAVFILQPNSERIGRMRTWLWEFLVWVGKEYGLVQDAWWHNSQAMPTLHCRRDYGLMRPSVKMCAWIGPEKCYRNQDAVLTEPAEATRKDNRIADDRLRYWPSSHHGRNSTKIGTCIERGGATPFNILLAGRGGGNGHSAGTPLVVCRWWTRYICPPGGVVLDPFMGSGTTGLACLPEGRLFVGVEAQSDYAEIARQRLVETIPKQVSDSEGTSPTVAAA